MSEIKTVTFEEYNQLLDSEDDINFLVDIETVPVQIRKDFFIRNDNVKNLRPLCDMCDGTGNEFFNMYRQCPICGGDGVRKDDGNE